MNNTGLYIHAPFCKQKCAYCDFYSFAASDELIDKYTAVLKAQIESYARFSYTADTLYFGGGTPTLLGGKRIKELIDLARSVFKLANAEITVEMNPGDDMSEDLKILSSAGVNRISLGVQSANENELKALGRRHSVKDAENAVKSIRAAGINNISLDLMLGVPHSDMDSLDRSIDYILLQHPAHISCYILKIEPDTPFGKADISTLCLPDDDTVSDMYLHTAERLANSGFEHYEISNFAKPGFRSRHNMKYWRCEEYLGFGPSAHSYFNGKRFYYERDFAKYLLSPTPVPDGNGGDVAEYTMLRCRLIDGLSLSELRRKHNTEISKKGMELIKAYENNGLVNFNGDTLSLTDKGFLVSNEIITQIITNFAK